jgi:hypothetical protein
LPGQASIKDQISVPHLQTLERKVDNIFLVNMHHTHGQLNYWTKQANYDDEELDEQ